MSETRDPANLQRDPNLQPMRDLTSDEYQKLKSRIRANGYEEDKPIVIDTENRVIDGNHRLEAVRELIDEGEDIEEIAVSLPTHIEDMTEKEKHRLAWELNLDSSGRQLDPGEKRASVKNYLREYGLQGMTEEEVAERLGVGQATVNRAKRDLEDAGENIQVNKFPSHQAKREAIRQHREDNPGESDSEVAQALGVARKTVATVRRETELREEVEHREDMKGDRIFPFPGSKAMVANWIVSKLPRHSKYVEPFGGSAAVLYNKPRSSIEVYNDADEDLVHFLRTLQEEPEGIEEALSDAEYSRQRHETWTRHWYEGWRPEIEPASEISHGSDAKRAAVFFFARFSNYKNHYHQLKGFYQPQSKADNEAEYYEKRERLTEFSERFEDVQIENRDYMEALEEHDGPNTFHFIDPPYVEKEEYYPGDFTHEWLVEAVNNLEGQFILSYGEVLPEGIDPEYRQVKLTGVPGERTSTEHYVTNVPAKEEGAFRNAAKADWG